MRIDVLSIFPDYLSPLHLSLVGKAIRSGLVDVSVHDLRAWTHNRHRTVDDTQFGGGAGMVMRPEPWGEALDDLVGASAARQPPRLIMLTPSGRVFDQRLAEELKGEEHLILACGRYEGIDARVVAEARTRMTVDEISIGDYVLNGGEAAALVLIEAVVRLIPGVVGNPESLLEESHSLGHQGLLEYPVYTKPPSWRGLDVPPILLSGHHAQVAAWRHEQAVSRTRSLRPDLLGPDLLGPDGPKAQDVDWALLVATPDDAGELFTLQRAAFVDEGRVNASFDIPPLTQTLSELVDSLTVGTVLVVRSRGRLVGSVRGGLTAHDVWHVGRLMVAPDRQGHGLGGRLMNEIEARAPSRTHKIRLVTGAASLANVGFYARRGYAEVTRSVNATGVEIIIMEKTLGDSP